jgi:hypothetical protein
MWRSKAAVAIDANALDLAQILARC